MLRRLLIRITVFVMPFIVVIGGAIAFAIYSGEAMPLAWVFAKQAADPRVVYFPSSREMNFRYKQFGIQHLNPDIVVLGTSLIRYVSADSFDPHARFYNAHFPAARTFELTRLMESFGPETAPEILIIGVDLEHIGVGGRAAAEIHDENPELSLEDILLRTRLIVQMVLQGDQSIARLLSAIEGADSQRLGIRATGDGRGFRFDGSMWEHEDARRRIEMTRDNVIQTEQALLIEAISSGALRIEAKPVAIETLFNEVSRLEEMGIEVIGIVMPFSMPSVMNVITGTALEADLQSLQHTLTEGFAASGAELFDFYDPRLLSLEDADIPDGVHTSREVTERLMADVIRQSPPLSTYARSEASDQE